MYIIIISNGTLFHKNVCRFLIAYLSSLDDGVILVVFKNLIFFYSINLEFRKKWKKNSYAELNSNISVIVLQ